MPVFPAIGVALGASAATATAVGVTAVGLAAAGIGASVYSSVSQNQQAKKAAKAMSQSSTETGAVTGQAAKDAVALRLARAGKVFTSPLGDTSDLSTASQKIFS